MQLANPRPMSSTVPKLLSDRDMDSGEEASKVECLKYLRQFRLRELKELLKASHAPRTGVKRDLLKRAIDLLQAGAANHSVIRGIYQQLAHSKWCTKVGNTSKLRLQCQLYVQESAERTPHVPKPAVVSIGRKATASGASELFLVITGKAAKNGINYTVSQ